ncbi:hypothetical protein [Woeseia oceani]|uniref:Uncharacterized protein n=1 Tax=Woeseia oceani TaxID=1548547 RepID=A0A193LC39_9GAMM|nr:hypothetical protein [Woeseia oceani]ANO50100.1 hypothetical protein BA177_01695 [Woeseia oceani]
MTPAAYNRRTRKPSARNALAVFVVAWLNLALAPCAMAFGGVPEPDCPHCPPSQADAHAGHDMSGHAVADHDGMEDAMPCASSATDCNVTDELNHDGRTLKLEPKDSPSDLVIAIHPALPSVATLRTADAAGWHRTRSPPLGATTPLNILYCVYLK